ncbi:excinuclease ABC subunit UvrC [Oharaeibacter diazotrophicus]|uniref:UvrABC system protein C n=1 Tax=Oharaeibacter diazotrophicus TaxID=1920512 RepID=A0A4R6R8W7_9HYPH|nr:excinuclease ABC subunit UvrC [Oharaeibacter diazotrophicus]TDP82491.1 excinuclease ABC subunit C [Oharaeibacter diazotrophicus]BBE72745.1 UvrABC system protein C [Pleomorphomonas sp. SM30]GLS76781.1 UvrABC system protein C [Oharaeibacter diazotrophicus]
MTDTPGPSGDTDAPIDPALLPLADEDDEAGPTPDLELEPTDEAEGSEVDLDSGETRKGAAVVAAMVKVLPNAPGVYRMLDAKGDVLYVGKAKSLKKRVANYVRLGQLPTRIIRMVQATAAMEFVRTATETEALLLEANLIKQLRPRFNVLLRDDKSFPYILIAEDHAAPQLVKHRGARTRKGRYFGPFASAGAVGRTINALQKAFLIRTCSDSVYETRTRPCLLHQIKRCAAPCTGEIATADYAELVREADAFLSGRSQAVKDELATAMNRAAEDLDFESAAVYRDRLAALSHVQSHQGINPQGVEEADVFAVHQEGGQTCVQVFFFRTGQNWGNHAFFPKAGGSEGGEVLSSFVAQFYDDKPVPRLVLVSHELEDMELMARALSEKAGHRVEVAEPRRGEKKDLVDHAVQNAREALARRLADSSSQLKLMEGVGRVFGLADTPRRIEVYDNSHIMGTNPVGAMIVAGPGGFMKTHYRKFNIRGADITPGDDFGMMREVMTRRFSRLMKEHGSKETAPRDEDGFGPWPDLVLIDGGAGQLSAAKAILDEIGLVDVPLVGVAKGPDRDAGRERFFVPGRADFMLPTRDPVLYFVQRLRDEAHRFAIGSHRARRSKQITQGGLQEIPGVGPTRKRALLNHFGTLKAIQRAALSDLEAVPGVSAATAKAIYDYFHESG